MHQAHMVFVANEYDPCYCGECGTASTHTSINYQEQETLTELIRMLGASLPDTVQSIELAGTGFA